MPRGRLSSASPTDVASLFSGFTSFVTLAESLGESLGRGIARGISLGLGGGPGTAPSLPAPGGSARRRGRPPKAVPVIAERRCKVEGCPNEVRSKGLCSKHYQASRRHLRAKTA